MAKRAPRPETTGETDRLDGFPHPRETFCLVGHSAALETAARAIRTGRPPQAWIITGPPGIGKATLAYRIARYLLRHGATANGPEDLSVPADDRVARQIMARAHPGLLLLKREPNPQTGKMMTVISVDVIRKLANFFGQTAEAGGWRVAIIDTADDMSEQAANALLKALEEPPSNAILLLLANAPGRLLPTIRSRCQRLDLRPIREDLVREQLATILPKTSEQDRVALAKLASGSIGAALALANEEGLALARDAEQAVDRAANPDYAALFAVADRLGRSGDNLSKFGSFLIDALANRICAHAHKRGAANLRRWIDAWDQVKANFERAEALNLEPRQTIVASVHAMNEVARRNPL